MQIYRPGQNPFPRGNCDKFHVCHNRCQFLLDPMWVDPSWPCVVWWQGWGHFLIFAATYPLDITKTRLQIQGELGHCSTVVSTPYRGMLRTAYGIGKKAVVSLVPFNGSSSLEVTGHVSGCLVRVVRSRRWGFCTQQQVSLLLGVARHEEPKRIKFHWSDILTRLRGWLTRTPAPQMAPSEVKRAPAPARWAKFCSIVGMTSVL